MILRTTVTANRFGDNLENVFVKIRNYAVLKIMILIWG